ncbi:MAG: MarR family winged helix-turn-helix transcriptional regulator [Pseudomonadaceae bacterium]
MQRPSLSHALQQVAHAYRSHMAQTIRHAELPLPVTHVRALKAVCYMDGCTAQRIAQRMRRDKAQITRVLNDLLEGGLISKASNPADKRSQLLHPTPEGEQLMLRIQQLEQQTLARMTRDLTQQEVEHFIRIAWHMTQNLEGDLPPDN